MSFTIITLAIIPAKVQKSAPGNVQPVFSNGLFFSVDVARKYTEIV